MKICPTLIKIYIQETNVKIHPEKQIWTIYFMVSLIGVAAGFLYCEQAFIKFFVVISLFISLVWAMILTEKNDCAKLSLYKGSLFILFSIFCFITAFNLQLKVSLVNVYQYISVGFLYIVLVLMNIKKTIDRIKKGYEKTDKYSTQAKVQLFTFLAFLGLLLGKLGKDFDTDTGNMITIWLIILLGLLLSVGTNNFLKYYFVKNGMDKDPNEV